jgi:tetratricopeptide (TPR) repeat protein
MTMLFVAAVCLFALVLPSTNAYADDSLAKPRDAEAAERLTVGNRLYRLGEFERAIDEYKAGALEEDAPVFHYNLGQCYRQLGRYEDAIWQYERFLARGKPTGEIKNAVDGFIKQMNDELTKKAMTQQPIEPAADPKSPAPAVPTSVTIVEHAEPWYKDGVGWGLAGAGTLGVGVSLGFFVSAQGLDDDANAETGQENRDRLHDRASDRRVIGAVVGVVGVGVLVTGVVKLIIRPTARSRTVKSFVGIGIVRDGLVVTGRF